MHIISLVRANSKKNGCDFIIQWCTTWKQKTSWKAQISNNRVVILIIIISKIIPWESMHIIYISSSGEQLRKLASQWLISLKLNIKTNNNWPYFLSFSHSMQNCSFFHEWEERLPTIQKLTNFNNLHCPFKMLQVVRCQITHIFAHSYFFLLKNATLNLCCLVCL